MLRLGQDVGWPTTQGDEAVKEEERREEAKDDEFAEGGGAGVVDGAAKPVGARVRFALGHGCSGCGKGAQVCLPMLRLTDFHAGHGGIGDGHGALGTLQWRVSSSVASCKQQGGPRCFAGLPGRMQPAALRCPPPPQSGSDGWRRPVWIWSAGRRGSAGGRIRGVRQFSRRNMAAWMPAMLMR